MTSQPNQPLTEEELATIRARADARTGPDHYFFTIDGIEYDGHWAHDTHRLLAEVERLRANLGALLVAEEQRCQMAINEAPTDPHLNGRLTGLQRARDIVTGDAFRALGLDQDEADDA